MQSPAVVVHIDIPAPLERVWEEAAVIEDHVEWMADAESLEFLSEERRGPGVRIAVETRIGPFRTRDEMTFVAWDPPRRMAVEHRGLFKGTGEFTFESLGPATTRMTWRERIEFPLFLGGPLGGLAAKPVLALVWRRNLRRFRRRFTA